MTNFIEVYCDGTRRLINTAWIEEIVENFDQRATIYFAFTSPNTYEQDSLYTDEAYSQIQEKIFARRYEKEAG